LAGLTCATKPKSGANFGACVNSCGDYATIYAAANATNKLCYNSTTCTSAMTAVSALLTNFANVTASNISDFDSCACNCPTAPASGGTAS